MPMKRRYMNDDGDGIIIEIIIISDTLFRSMNTKKKLPTVYGENR